MLAVASPRRRSGAPRRASRSVLASAEALARHEEPLPVFSDGTSPGAWLEQLRGLRRSWSRVMVVVHLFAGLPRAGDV